MRRALALLAGLACAGLAASAPVRAHEVRPAYLQLREAAPGTWDVLWKVPARGELRLGLDVRLPDACTGDPGAVRATGGAFVERWRARCEAGLVGSEVRIEGLAGTRTDVLARVEHADGHSQTVRLTPEAASFTVEAAPGGSEVARTYFALGVEHILQGLDHMLFVLALLLLVGGTRRLLATVTAFTVAHSFTLAAATLGWVRVAVPPVEATIALSIVFVAAEIVRKGRGAQSLTERRPWVVAFAFGLLHGLGFAGALRQVGLPETAIPLSLAFFNVGVEAGQLLFVAAAVSVLAVMRPALTRLAGRPVAGLWDLADVVARPAAYGIGVLAAWWVIERTLGFWAA